jgi:hypothetical protein
LDSHGISFRLDSPFSVAHLGHPVTPCELIAAAWMPPALEDRPRDLCPLLLN